MIRLKKSVVIEAPVQVVFSAWADFHNFPRFIHLIDSVIVIDEKRSRWIIKAPLEYRVRFDSEIIELIPNQRLVWESHHAAGDTKGTLTFNDEWGSTRVDLVFNYAIRSAWVQKLAELMHKLGFPSRSFDEGLRRIKDEIERSARGNLLIGGSARQGGNDNSRSA